VSRHGYSEDLDPLEHGHWRGMVASAIRGKRGQRLLRDIAAYMDAMPVKALVRGDLVTPEGDACALGCAFLYRKIAATPDPEDPEAVAEALDISHVLAKEVAYVNDEFVGYDDMRRWTVVRQWIRENLREEAKPNG